MNQYKLILFVSRSSSRLSFMSNSVAFEVIIIVNGPLLVKTLKNSKFPAANFFLEQKREIERNIRQSEMDLTFA